VARWDADGRGGVDIRLLLADLPDLRLGIGLVFNAWDVYREPVSEERIRREMGRLR
jgi:hypothetical protein